MRTGDNIKLIDAILGIGLAQHTLMMYNSDVSENNYLYKLKTHIVVLKTWLTYVNDPPMYSV